MIKTRVIDNFKKFVTDSGGVAQAAARIGITRAGLYMILNGSRSPSLELLDDVLRLTGVDLTKLPPEPVKQSYAQQKW